MPVIKFQYDLFAWPATQEKQREDATVKYKALINHRHTAKKILVNMAKKRRQLQYFYQRAGDYIVTDWKPAKL